MAEVFFSVLTEKLSCLIQREIRLIMGVDKEMKKLSSTLTTLQTVMEDAEDKQIKSNAIRNWLIKVDDIAYEIDDILDECATEASKLQHKGCSFTPKKIYFRRKIGRRMEQLAERLDAVAADCCNFHLRELVVPRSSEVNAKREMGFVLNEPDHICGRDQDRDKIVDILVNQGTDRQQLAILSIVGVGGLGKTTLAQLVYNDQRITQHYDAKLWVCVSDNFDLRTLLKAMIELATGSAPDLVHLAALQHRLREVLHQKKYLLVLDDVWNDDQEDWATLKSILACGAKGASVVLTTRLQKVAEIMGTLPSHCLAGLSEEHCWLLFRLRAFGQEEEECPNLETIGRQILKKCAGVPLAAKALGGLLRFKREEKDWIHVKESEIWNFPEEENSILPVLRLSYRHLPPVLRRCFVHCAVFPKNSVIEKQDLILRWMAYGCISPNGIQEMEDVGDQAWNELVLRSFFQEVNTSRRRTTFKMHDLVHDLAQSIVENKISGEQAKSSRASASNSKIREVCVGRHSRTSPSSITIQVSELTTITTYSGLRILNISNSRIVMLSSAICKMKHLRYLNLSNSSICTLPRTFCELWNLQTLVLNYCRDLKSLPKPIRYMSNLRHVFLERCKSLSHIPSRIEMLTSLRTLSVFIVGDRIGNQLDELERLNLGGSLKIKQLEQTQNHMNAKKANLVEKPNLRALVLDWKGDCTSKLTKPVDDGKVLEALEPHPNLEILKIRGFKGSYFPLWMTKMENVTEIVIKNCPNCSRLLLGGLPRLKFLCLKKLVALEYIVSDEARGQSLEWPKFPSLESLGLDSLPKLKGLSKEEVGQVFPNLQRLYISDCLLLILPSMGWIQHLTALEVLIIRSCSELVELPEEIKHLHLLKRLILSRLDNMVSLPQVLQHIPSLIYLGLNSLPQLTSLPDWLGNLASLTHLEVISCPGIPSIPSSIQGMTNLRFLEIWDCPQLARRCEKGKGEDWHKIAHIPQLHIEFG